MLLDLVYLSEQSLAATTCGGGVINVNIMIFSGDWLLDEGLVKRDAVDLHVVLGLDQLVI